MAALRTSWVRGPPRSAVVGDLLVEDLHGPAQCRRPLLQGGTALAEEGDPVLRNVSARRMATKPRRSAMPRPASRKHVTRPIQKTSSSVYSLRPPSGAPDRADQPFALVVAQRVEGDAGAVGGRCRWGEWSYGGL